MTWWVGPGVGPRTKDSGKTPGVAWKCKHKLCKTSVGQYWRRKIKKYEDWIFQTHQELLLFLKFFFLHFLSFFLSTSRRRTETVQFARACACNYSPTYATCTNTHAHVRTRTSRGRQVEAGPQLWRSSLADRRCGRRHKSSPDKHRALNKRRVAPLVLSPSYLTCHVTPAATPRPV